MFTQQQEDKKIDSGSLKQNRNNSSASLNSFSSSSSGSTQTKKTQTEMEADLLALEEYYRSEAKKLSDVTIEKKSPFSRRTGPT